MVCTDACGWQQPRSRQQRRVHDGDVMSCQVLDSYDNLTYFDGQAGALYKQSPPMVNAMRKPGEWNTYDVFGPALSSTNGSLKSPAYITVMHNGVLIQNHFALLGGHTVQSSAPVQQAPWQGTDLIARPRQPCSLSQHLGARVKADCRRARTRTVHARWQQRDPGKEVMKVQSGKGSI